MTSKRNNLVTYTNGVGTKLYLHGPNLYEAGWTKKKSDATRYTFVKAYNLCQGFKRRGFEARIMPIS